MNINQTGVAYTHYICMHKLNIQIVILVRFQRRHITAELPESVRRTAC